MSSGALNNKIDEIGVGDFTNFESPYVVVWELHGSKNGLVKHDPNPTFYLPRKHSSSTAPKPTWLQNVVGASRSADDSISAEDLISQNSKKEKLENSRNYPLWTELETYLRPMCSNITVNDSGKNKQSPPTMMSVDGVLNMNRKVQSSSDLTSPQPNEDQVVDNDSRGVPSLLTSKQLPALNIIPSPNKSLSPLTPSIPSTSSTVSYQSIITSNVFYSSVEQFTCKFRLSNDTKLNNCHSRYWSVMYTNPYMHIMIVMCDDSDDYKTNIKPKLRDWVNYMNDKDYEYLILHVPTSQNESLLKKLSLYRVFDKLKTDFNDRRNGVDHVIKIVLNAAQQQQPNQQPVQLHAQQFKDLAARIRDGILVEFARRCGKYEEEIKKFDENRKYPGWQFGHYFIAKENLALTIEQFGLHVNALGIYSQLFSFYVTDDAVRLDSFIKTNEKQNELCEILNTRAKPYREMIYSTTISEFDFYNYVFARQIQLFFKMNNPYEAAVHTKEFIPHMVHEMQVHMLPDPNNNTLQRSEPSDHDELHFRNFIFIHAWAYCTTQCVVEACQERAFETNAQVLAKLCRTLGDLYVFTRFQLQILSYMFGLDVTFLSSTKTNHSQSTDISSLPHHLRSPHLLPHILKLDRVITTETKNRILESIRTEYDVAIRLKQTVRDQSEFGKLYLELSSAASRGYSNGQRDRFHHWLNGEIAQIRFQQGNYTEAMSLWRGQLTAYYHDGWNQPSTIVRIKLSECEKLVGQLEDYMNSCLSLCSTQSTTDQDLKKFYHEELRSLSTRVDVNSIQPRMLGNEFLIACINGTDGNDDSNHDLKIEMDRVTLSAPVGSVQSVSLQILNVSLPNDFSITGISLHFTCQDEYECDDSDDDDDDDDSNVIQSDQITQEVIFVRRELIKTLPRNEPIEMVIDVILSKRGLFTLDRVSVHVNQLEFIIDKVMIPGDFESIHSTKTCLPTSNTRMKQLPKRFVTCVQPITSNTNSSSSFNHHGANANLNPSLRIDSPVQENVTEMSLDSFLTNDSGNGSSANLGPKLPKPLKMTNVGNLNQSNHSLPGTPTGILIQKSDFDVDSHHSTDFGLLHNQHLHSKPHLHRQMIKSKKSSHHQHLTAPTPPSSKSNQMIQNSFLSPLSPTFISPSSSTGSVKSNQQSGNHHQYKYIWQDHKRILYLNVHESPSTLRLQAHVPNGCLISNQDQILNVSIMSMNDALHSEIPAKLTIENLNVDDDVDFDLGDVDSRTDDDVKEEFEMTNEAFSLHVGQKEFTIPSLGVNQIHTIKVPIKLSKKSFSQSSAPCVIRNVKITITYQKDLIASNQPLFVVSQLEPLCFYEPFVTSHHVKQLPGKPTLLQVNLECTAPCPVNLMNLELEPTNIEISSNSVMKPVTLMPEQSMNLVFLIREDQDQLTRMFKMMVAYRIWDPSGQLGFDSSVMKFKSTLQWTAQPQFVFHVNITVRCAASLIRVGAPCICEFEVSQLGDGQPADDVEDFTKRKWWQVQGDVDCWIISGHVRQLHVNSKNKFECPIVPMSSGYLAIPKIHIENSFDHVHEHIQYVYRIESNVENKIAGNRLFIYPDSDAQMGPFFPLDFPVTVPDAKALPTSRPHSSSNPAPLSSNHTPGRKIYINKKRIESDLVTEAATDRTDHSPLQHLSDYRKFESDYSLRRTDSSSAVLSTAHPASINQSANQTKFSATDVNTASQAKDEESDYKSFKELNIHSVPDIKVTTSAGVLKNLRRQKY
ncbi:trafficking protein particle complex subunit [Acrasis kona]|uniref:Trafficking protein particle complex subunit n=1 Tax=Acrasis kona TaxID=1008807 RepID=A0AAW2ZA06_9EUKA